jgi:hypothetical protein
MVTLSTGHVTSGPRRTIAAEVDKPQLMITEKSCLTCEWYTIESENILNTIGKL